MLIKLTNWYIDSNKFNIESSNIVNVNYNLDINYTSFSIFKNIDNIGGNYLRLSIKSSPDINLILKVTDINNNQFLYYVPRNLSTTHENDSYISIIDLNKAFFKTSSNRDKIKQILIQVNNDNKITTSNSLTISSLEILDSLNDFKLDLKSPSIKFSTPVTNDLGICWHYYHSRSTFSKVKSAGFNIIRTDLTWEWVENIHGKYDFSWYDTLVKDITNSGLKVLFILCYGHPDYDCNTDGGIDAFCKYAEASVKHFNTKSVRFEIWNEPNGFWNPTPNSNQYSKLCIEASRRMKLINPNVIISTGGLGYFDFPFLKDEVYYGIKKYINNIGIHGYRYDDPETIVDSIITAKKLINDESKSIDITEWGYSLDKISNVTDGSSSEFNDIQAKITIRMILSKIALGLPTLFLYDMVNDGTDKTNSEHNYGLFNANYTEKLNLTAIRFFNNLTNDKEYRGLLYSNNGVNIIKYENASSLILIMWHINEQRIKIKLPNENLISITNIFGNVLQNTTIVSNICNFNSSKLEGPYYIQYKK